MRQYSFAAPGAINQFALATDDVTGLSVQQLNKDNAIIDFVNAIDPEPRSNIKYNYLSIICKVDLHFLVLTLVLHLQVVPFQDPFQLA